MSEHAEEPGTIKPVRPGRHLLSNVPINLFQIKLALNIKFIFDMSRFIFGKRIEIFDSLKLG